MVDASCGVSQDATDVTIPDYKFCNVSQTVANWLVTAHSCFSQNSIQVTSRPMNSLLSSRSTRSRPSRSRFAQEKSFLASRPPSRNCAQISVYVLRIKSKKTGTHSQRTVVNLHNSGYPSKWEVTNALVQATTVIDNFWMQQTRLDFRHNCASKSSLSQYCINFFFFKWFGQDSSQGF